MHVLEVVETVAALAGAAGLQIRQEGIILLVAGTYHLNVDLPLVFDVEDHIAVLFVLFDLFVCGLADVRYCYA